MAKYNYILLDWDGNLAQTLHIWLEACRQPLLERGFDLDDQTIAASFGSFVQHMRDWGVRDPEAVLAETDDIAKHQLPGVDLYPDSLEVLEQLHSQGKKMALITTSSHQLISDLLDKHDLHRYFEAIVAGDDVNNHKPHAEPLQKGLNLLKGIKAEAVMIGDSDKDLGAANNFGIDSILFYPDEHKKFYDLEKLQAHNPTYVVRDFREVLDIVGI